jgi:hypothetical protein
MSDPMIPADRREFHCVHCEGKIVIPIDLPPTTGPCPHCGEVITSPAPTPPAPVFEFRSPTPGDVPPIPQVVPTVPAPLENRPPPPPPPPTPTPPPQKIEETPHPLAKEEVPKIELPHHEPVSEPKVAKKKTAPAEGKRRSGLIPAMVVLLILGLAGGGIFYFVSKGHETPVAPPVVKTPDPASEITEAHYIRVGWQKDAYELLSGYMAATDTQGKLSFILNSEALTPKIEDFYGGGTIMDSDTPAEAFSIYELSEEDRKRGLFMMIYDQPPQFEMKEFFRPLASLEVQYGVDEADLLLSTLARVGNFAMEPLRVHAFFKRTGEGLKLDWEIFAQTKYRTLQNFVELPEFGQSGIFRVFIIEDVPDKGRAVPGTRTYRVADPANTGDTARVNVKVDSEIGRTLSLINWRGTKESRPITRTATVELKWTGEPDAPELEISRFICWEFLGLGGQETPSTASTK